MTAKIIAHAEPFAVVVSDCERGTVIVTAGAQGPSGKNGSSAAISKEKDNRLEQKPDGFYVRDDLVPDPLAYYILAKN